MTSSRAYLNGIARFVGKDSTPARVGCIRIRSHDNVPLFEPGETTLPVVQKSPVKDFPSQIARDFNGVMRGLDAGRDSRE